MFIQKVITTHEQTVDLLRHYAGDWFMGLMARFVFASVLLLFFLNAASTKLGSGFPGIFLAKVGAYAQILPTVAESVGYNISKISFIPWGLIVHLGAYAEVLLPIMIVLGLFARLASLSMIGFIIVMTFVDIQFHNLPAESIGSMFDRVHDSVISDQRLLWVFPLVYLVMNGGGSISCDRLLKRLF